jgi:hypothetical protein
VGRLLGGGLRNGIDNAERDLLELDEECDRSWSSKRLTPREKGGMPVSRTEISPNYSAMSKHARQLLVRSDLVTAYWLVEELIMECRCPEKPSKLRDRVLALIGYSS